MVNVIVKTINGGQLPKLMTAGAAGFDLIANESIIITPGEKAFINTGLQMAIPRGYEGQIRPRSGIAAKTDLIIPNSPGTIDSDYRGEICVMLFNVSAPEPSHRGLPAPFKVWDLAGKILPYTVNQGIAMNLNGKCYKISKGDRIAQIVFAKVESISLVVADGVVDLGETERGSGGFGHTGI